MKCNVLSWIGVVLVVSSCASLPEDSDFLQLAHLDETLVDVEGLETKQMFDPIVLLQQGEAYRIKGEYGDAVAAYQRFLELYPYHRMAAFAQYALGVSHMKQIQTRDRDPTPIEQAALSFNQVVQRYPETPYAPKAMQHLETLAKYRAEHQWGIGYYYYKQKIYHAAIPRFEKGLAMGGDHGAVTERLLYYLGSSYVQTGNPDKANQIFQELLTRYPHSDYIHAPCINPAKHG